MLVHVTTGAEWAAAQQSGVHAPPGLTRHGFLHCCTEAQLPFVLARHFAGRDGLVALRFDSAGTGALLRWEQSEPGQAPFPHLFGPLTAASVLTALPARAPCGKSAG